MNFNHLPPRMRHKFKLKNNKMEESSASLDDEIELMSSNLLKVKRELTEEEEHQMYDGEMANVSSHGGMVESQNGKTLLGELRRQQILPLSTFQLERNELQNQQPHDQTTSPYEAQSSISSTLIQKYQSYLTQNKFSSNYEEKINQLLDSEQRTMSIGNSIALFEMVYYFREILTVEVLEEIQSKAFESFVALVTISEQDFTHKMSYSDDRQGGYSSLEKSENEFLKVCLCEVISICGVASQEIIQFFVQYMIEHPEEFVLCYKLLINMGYTGVSTLIKILNQDFQEFTEQLLTNLARSEFIIQNILVPNITNDLTNSTVPSKEKNLALSVLSRLGEVAYSDKLIQVLVGLFKSNTIDKSLLISAIKATGKQQGERILIDLLQQPSLNQEIAVLIIRCLSQPQSQKKCLRPQIVVSENPLSNASNKMMSKLYYYQPAIDTPSSDILYINPRIFCSLMEKLSDHIDDQRLSQTQMGVKHLQCSQMFVLPKVISKDEEETLPNLEVVSLLMGFVDKSNKKNE